MLFNNSSSRILSRNPSPPIIVWAAIGGLFLLTGLGSLAGFGSLIRLFFPVGAFAVGIFLYCRYPVLYVGFTWWVVFLTPLLRRLTDYYRGSFDESSLMLVAPYLVTLISAVTFFRYLPRSHRQGNLPFVLAAGGVFFGFLVGLVHGNPSSTVIRTLLDWMPPILFGFHLSVSWRDYPEIRSNIQQTFFWGVLLMGLYGVYQYLVAPEWDRSWLINVENTSFGNPEPFEIRVWSTMNGPGVFASTLIPGLLLLFTNKKIWSFPSAVVGYLAFLLSLVRTAWGGWVVGLLTLLASLRSNFQMRLIAAIIIMAVCLVPMATMEPFSEVVQERVETLADVRTDSSYKARAETYDENLNIALSSFLGRGLGSTWIVRSDGTIERVALDSGILDTFFTLGWFGGLPYLGGLILLLFSQFLGAESRFDAFASTVRAITVSSFVQLGFGSVMLGPSGMVLWGFIGIGIASRKYHLFRTRFLKSEEWESPENNRGESPAKILSIDKA